MIEKEKLSEIEEKVNFEVNGQLWGSIEEKEKYRSTLKKQLLEQAIEETKLESELLESDKKVQSSRLVSESLRHEREIQQSEIDEYNDWMVQADRIWAKRDIYYEADKVNPEGIMDEFKDEANDLKKEIEDLSEQRRDDKNNVFNRMLGQQDIVEIGKHIANEEERKIFDSFLNGSNGQIDLADFMRQMPETMKGYLEAGNYHINATLDGINRKADTIHHISDNMFHDGNTFKRTILETEEIEQAIMNVRKSEIDTELQAIRTEKTQEKDNSIEERE